MQPELARHLLDDLERSAPTARSRADAGDPAPLAGLLARTLRAHPDAADVREPSVRRDLRGADPALGEALDRWFAAPLAREAKLRAALATARVPVEGASGSLAGALRLYRGPDEARRRAVRVALDPELERVAREHALDDVLEAYAGPADAKAEPAAPKPAAPKPLPPPPRPGVILLPSAEVLQSLAAGGPLDPALLAGLAASSAAAPSPARSAPPPAPASGLIALPTEEELRDLAKGTGAQKASDPAAAEEKDLRELLFALADALGSGAPASFGAWRAAAAGAGLADYRPAQHVLARWAPSRVHTLPFEQPGAPLARARAVNAQDPDAAASTAILLGVAASNGEPALGAALALTAPTRAFVRFGLADAPSDLERVARGLALALGCLYAGARIAARAAGSVEATRDLYQDLLGAAPPEALARWWAAEPAFARAPGESSAIYAHTGATAALLLRGLALAASLRERWDEDWFRNPRLDLERAREHAAAVEPATPRALTRWLREHAQL